MKTLPKTLLLFLLVSNGLLAQNRTTENSPDGEGQRTIKQVDQVNNASEEINQASAQTAEAVKGTVSNTKDAIKEIGSLFGSDKEKGFKGTVTIGIQPITYDDPHLNALYEHISSVRGVKNPNKNFSNGSVIITVAFKDNADALWQSIPDGLRSPFTMVQMGDDQIVVQPIDTP